MSAGAFKNIFLSLNFTTKHTRQRLFALVIHSVSGCTFAKGRETREEALRPKFIEGKGIAANVT